MSKDQLLFASDLDPGDRDFYDASSQMDTNHPLNSSALSMNSVVTNFPSTQQVEEEIQRKRMIPDDEGDQTNKKKKTQDASDNNNVTLQDPKGSKTQGPIFKPRFPTNHTLNRLNSTYSSNTNITIIIAPTGDNKKEFTNSPIAINRGLTQYPFSLVKLKEVRRNRRRNIVAIEMDHTETDIIIQEILNSEKLDKFKVKCYRPMSDTTSYGVIGPIEAGVTEQEIMDIIKCHGCDVVKVTRLYKFNRLQTSESTQKKTPSLTFKLDFNSTELPKRVYLENMSFNVRTYNQPPLKCYNCQRFGHMASGCTQTTRCNICAGNHQMSDCLSLTKKCANCGGQHVSSSGECTFNKDAAKIESLRSKGSSFAEARNIVIGERPTKYKYNFSRSRNPSLNNSVGLNSQRNNELNQQIEIPILEKEDKPLYSNIMQGKNYNQDNSSNSPEVHTDMNTIKQYVDQAIANTSVKLVGFLQEIFSMQLFKENMRGRKQLLLNVAKHHFGNSVDDEALRSRLHIESPERDI